MPLLQPRGGGGADGPATRDPRPAQPTHRGRLLPPHHGRPRRSARTAPCARSTASRRAGTTSCSAVSTGTSGAGAGSPRRRSARPRARPLEGVRRYLRAATLAVNVDHAAFAARTWRHAGGPAIRDAHTDYLVAVTRELLDMAVEQGEIAPVDTLVVARTMAGISDDLHPARCDRHARPAPEGGGGHDRRPDPARASPAHRPSREST